jgi:hypothetical protein
MKWFLRKAKSLAFKLFMYFNDALDDPMQFEMSSSFEGGMVSNQRANSIGPNQATLIQNLDLTRIGELTTRRGTARVGGGTVNGSAPIIRMARFSTTAGVEQLVASVNNGGFPHRLYYYVDAGAWTLATASIPMQAGYCPIVQGVDKLYMRGSDLHLYSWDGTTAVDLGGGGANQPPLGGPSLVWFTNRLIADDGRDAFAFSDFLDPTTWDATASIRVGAGEDDYIMGVCKWTQFNLIVAKRRSLWIVNCDPTAAVADFEIKCLHSKIGTRAPQTFVQVGADVYGLTTHGVRSMQQTFAAENQTELGPSLSYPIEDYIDRINKSAIATATATYWKNRYILSVPLDAATTPNYTFVFNTITRSWTGFWTGWNPKAFTERLITADGSLRLVFGDNSGNVFEWMDYVAVASEVSATFQDNGSAIASRLTTKAFDLGEPVSPKTGMTCEVEYTSAGNLTGQLVADGSNAGSAVSLSSSQSRKAFDVQSIGQFRELQVDLNASSGKQTIRKVHVGGFIDSLSLQS